MAAVKVETRWVGDGHPCFIVAEVGINHNGDIELARKMIDAAADAGADAVKFQNYHTEDFVIDRTLEYTYLSQGRAVQESQYDMFKRYELPVTALGELSKLCRDRGVIFFTTPTSEQGIAEAVQAGATLLKNGSDYLTHIPMVRAMARTGLPTVISTGMATAGEIDDAVRVFRSAGGRDLILLHCTSSYPTPPEDVHLRKMATLANAFECPVGLSDHTEGIVASIGAVALGACFVEKHFTLDRTLPGPDHRFSSDPTEFEALVKAIRTLESSLGHSALGLTAAEECSRRSFRLSLAAAHDLPIGHQLMDIDVIFRRPGDGLPPNTLPLLLGKRTTRHVRSGQSISVEDFCGGCPHTGDASIQNSEE